MVNITIAVPENLKDELKKHKEVNWSEVARKAIIERIETLRLAEKLASKNKLSEKDVMDFSEKIKSLATKRFLDANSN